MRHLLLAATPAERLFRLRGLDPLRYEWVAVPNWAEAAEAIRAKPIDMAVVDPLLGGEPRSHEIERLRVYFPSLPLLLYTDLTPATAGVLLELGRAGIRRAVFSRFEDAPNLLRQAIKSELEQSASQRVLHGLSGLLTELPAEIRSALETIVHSPGEGLTVSALAKRAHLTRKSCERWFTRAGLPSPRAVMVLGRLLYAHRLLLDPGYTVEDVALKLGYSKTKTLQMQLRSVFGATAGELRLSLSADEALAVVTNRYFAQPSHAAAS